MDADLFTLKKKPNSAPAQTKPFGKNIPKATEITTSDNNAKHEGAGKSVLSPPIVVNQTEPLIFSLRSGEQGTTAGRKPHSAPSVSTRSHRRFSFSGEGTCFLSIKLIFRVVLFIN